MNAAIGRLSWIRVPIYMVAQYIGAFCGAACVYGIYHDTLNHFDGGVRVVVGQNASAAIFATYPRPYNGIIQCIFEELFGTMMLALCLMAMTDPRNMKTRSGVFPFAVATIVSMLNLAYPGATMNPARDFSPRSFTAMAGWGSGVFSAYDYHFWIPLVLPHFGATLGACIYLLLIGSQHPPDTGGFATDTSSVKSSSMKNSTSTEIVNY
jgi:aquaporin-9